MVKEEGVLGLILTQSRGTATVQVHLASAPRPHRPRIGPAAPAPADLCSLSP